MVGPDKSQRRGRLGLAKPRVYLLSGGVCKAALAHVRDRVEAAYRRTNLFERRRQLMEDCATYLSGEDEVNFR